MTTVTCPTCASTFTVALPHEGVVPMGPRNGTLVTFSTPARALPAGAVTTFGAPVEAFAKGKESALDDADGVWMVIAYAVSMKDSEVTLSKEDFEAAVANHARYPACPLVIEHEDTNWWNPRIEWAEPHGHVEELRVGEAEVEEMDGTKRTAATLEGRVTFLPATLAEVKARKWRFVSITLAKGMKDEATGAPLGALLWSLSLTAHPRLTGLDPIPASLRERLNTLSATDRAELLAALGVQPAPQPPAQPPPTPAPMKAPTPTETATAMKTFLEHAHVLGLAATSEDDARDKVLAFAAHHGQTLKLFSLAPATTPTELASKVADLQATAGRVPALEQKLATQEAELSTYRAEKTTREKAELDQHLAELFCVQPELKAAEEALRFQAEHNREAFTKKHPRPSPEELAQAVQHGARLAPIVPPAQRPAAPGSFALPNAGNGQTPVGAQHGAPQVVDASALVASLSATLQATGQADSLGQSLRG